MQANILRDGKLSMENSAIHIYKYLAISRYLYLSIPIFLYISIFAKLLLISKF